MREKNVRFNVLCKGCVDLTDASVFNGVEQCEKRFSRCGSMGHRMNFIPLTLSFSLFFFYITIFFYPQLASNVFSLQYILD